MKKIATIMAIVFAVCLFMTGQSIAAGGQTTGAAGQTETRTGQQPATGADQTQTQQTPGISQSETWGEGQAAQSLGQGLQASKLMDMEVQGQNQENLGNVSDLYVSEDGKVEYLFISRGGVMGIGEDLVPIPWDQVQRMGEEDTLIVNITEQRLENAPAFSEDDLQQMEWQQEVRGYYGQEQQDRLQMRDTDQDQQQELEVEMERGQQRQGY
jgi:sporulation protein YlmC with PRC-barrel domain